MCRHWQHPEASQPRCVMCPCFGSRLQQPVFGLTTFHGCCCSQGSVIPVIPWQPWATSRDGDLLQYPLAALGAQWLHTCDPWQLSPLERLQLLPQNSQGFHTIRIVPFSRLLSWDAAPALGHGPGSAPCARTRTMPAVPRALCCWGKEELMCSPQLGSPSRSMAKSQPSVGPHDTLFLRVFLWSC